jgi:hypothetical protein
MKKFLFLLGFIALVSSCKKEDSSVPQGVDMQSAVRQLSSANEWRLSDIYVDKTLIFANGKPLDGKKMVKVSPTTSIEFEYILEKAIFGDNGKGRVKYADQTDFEDFKYEIDNVKKLLIIKNDVEDELYRISGGSIQSTRFDIDTYMDGVLIKLTLKSN